MSERSLRRWLRIAPVVAFGVLAWLERKRPLRSETGDKTRRLATNLTVGTTSAIVASAAALPVLFVLGAVARRRGWGIARHVGVPRPARVVAAALTMDYVLWWWHRMNHRVPALWRFHRAHHADRDLDLSTALRFHYGELLLATPVRAFTMMLLGLEPPTYLAAESAVLAFIEFHHSNTRLPASVDAALRTVFVTPRVHGIHHSDRTTLRNANFGTVFTFWDRLHGTWEPNVPHDGIRIGIPNETDPPDVRARDVLKLPHRTPP